jgi:2-polyprenyl-3-methyl-5-hydroxy-6-metoxy-1,4-benzoquinol methylase
MVYFFKDARILDLAKGKRVLHLGCVGFADLPTTDRVALARESLHYALSNVARVVGVDYSRDAIEYFRSNGVFTNVTYGNAEKLDEAQIDGPFDVVVVGDIVEHLSNPGLMLDGVRRFCNARTSVVITTPHSFGLLSFLKHVFARFVEGKEHVMTFNAQNIANLCARHGFQIVSIDTCYQKHAMKQRLFPIGKLFFKAFPNLGGTLFVIAKLVT